MLKRKAPLTFQTGSTQKINVVALMAVSFIVLVILLAWFALARIEGNMRAEAGDALQTVLHTTHESLTLWAENGKYHLSRLAQDPRLVEMVERHLDVPRNKHALQLSRTLKELREFFRQNKDRFGKVGFFIISPDYINIGSMREGNLGDKNLISYQGLDLLKRAFKGETIFVPPIRSDVALISTSANLLGVIPTMFFAAPVKNAQGEVIAVVAQRIDPAQDFTRLIQLGRLGKTGETFAFGQYGRLLSESRFDDELQKIGLIKKGQKAILNVSIRDPGGNLLKGFSPKVPRYQQPLTLMAEQATKGNSGFNVQGYRDYRGAPVFGAWLWDGKLGIGLATEIDESEALRTYRATRTVIIVVLGITVLLALGSLGFAVIIDERANKALQKSNEELEMRVKERTAELRKLSNATENSPASVVVTNIDGIIEYVNPTFSDVTGYTAEEVIGRNPRVLKSGDLPPSFYQNLWETILAGKIWKGDFINRKKNGEEFWESASISPITNEEGKITHFVAVKQDITERKQMEDELIQAKHEADEANKAKGDFLANMSHEIRTPMNAVIGMAHLALKTDLSRKQRDYLKKIQTSANALLGIINDILDFSKIEAGKMDMESVDFNLDDVLANLANLVTVKTQEKEELEVLFATAGDVPRYLVGDSLRLGQVLINLANNAVKFTDAGEIVVSIEKIEEKGDQVTLKFGVTDTGIGLTEDQMAKLFQSFSQADTSTTRKYGGTGLGLAISKKLVNMMGGDIWVESIHGRGTTFNFTAKFGIGNEVAKKQLSPSADLRGMRVLVVDDNATSREILKDILESFSFDVSLAASGKEGITEVENADSEKPFDLVVMDWKMPGMDGIEASKYIKNHSALNNIPAIILVTAYGREEIMRKCDQAGLDGFLIKPVNPSVFFDTIMQAFGKDIAADSPIVSRQKEADAVEQIRGAMILLVEDNEINQQVAKEILEGAGLHVTLADNGQEAVDAVKATEFDAVLMDVQMPVMDGYTATRKIREWELKAQSAKLIGDEPAKTLDTGDQKPAAGPRRTQPSHGRKPLPIIAMTAHAMAGDEERSLAAGMNGHVTKPIDPEQLFSVLQKWITPGVKRTKRPHAPDDAEAPGPPSPKPDPEEFPAALPGFNLAEGLKRLQGNKRLYRKLLQNFGNKYTQTAKEIRTALDARDFHQAHGLVHNLKGLAGNLEAVDLQAAAMALEKIVKNADPDNPPQPDTYREQLSALDGVLSQALEAVQILDAAPDEKPPGSAGEELALQPSDLPEGVPKRLGEAAELGDIEQIQSIATELKSHSNALIPVADKLDQLAEDFDFDGVLKLADDLKH